MTRKRKKKPKKESEKSEDVKVPVHEYRVNLDYFIHRKQDPIFLERTFSDVFDAGLIPRMIRM